MQRIFLENLPDIAGLPHSSALEYLPSTVDDEDDRLISEAIAYTARAADTFAVAVAVGSRGGAVLRAIKRAMPNLAEIVVFEPDLRSLAVLRTQASTLARELAPIRCTVVPIEDHRTEYHHAVHIELINYLMTVGQPRGSVLPIFDPMTQREAGLRYTSTSSAVHDLLWAGSTNFLDLLDRSGKVAEFLQTPVGRMLRRWPDTLFDQGDVLAALQWYTLLYREMPSPNLATRIAIAWGQIGCPDLALTWLGRSAVPMEARQAAQQEIAQIATEHRQQAEAIWRANVTFLRGAWPEAAAAIEGATSAPIDVVWLNDIAWSLRVGPSSFAVERELYPLLISHDAGRVRPLNLPQHPSILRGQLGEAVAPTKRHVCVGSMRQYAGLMNALRNRVVSTVPNWRQSVVICDTDPAQLRVLCEAVDFTTALQASSLEKLWLGPDAESRLVGFFADAPWRPVPKVRVSCSPALAKGLERLEDERKQAYDRAASELAAHYGDETLNSITGKILRGEPLRVWAWTSIHTTVLQHVAHSLARGFRELGHDTELLVETDTRQQLEPHAIAGSLANFKPDLVFLLDHTRPEYGQLMPASVPLASWVLDELPALTDPRVLPRLGPCDYAFAWSRPITEHLLKAGYPHCEQLPFAVDTNIYHRGNETPDNKVAFATHLSFPFEPTYAPGLYREIERRFALLPRVPSGHNEIAPILASTLEEHGWKIPERERQDVAYQCLMVARHADRIRIADQIIKASLPLALYGRGWEEIERFRPYALGNVMPGEALCQMYRRHKVVLHINTRCNLHPRVLEAAAAGTFVLARSDGDWDFLPGAVNDYLKVNRELCLFDDEQDMVAKIRRALADETWRQQFVQAAHDRVHRDHTYRARAQAMLDSIRSTLTSRRSHQGSDAA